MKLLYYAFWGVRNKSPRCSLLTHTSTLSRYFVICRCVCILSTLCEYIRFFEGDSTATAGCRRGDFGVWGVRKSVTVCHGRCCHRRQHHQSDFDTRRSNLCRGLKKREAQTSRSFYEVRKYRLADTTSRIGQWTMLILVYLIYFQMRLSTAPGYISVNLSHQYLMNSRNQLSHRYFAYPRTPSTL